MRKTIVVALFAAWSVIGLGAPLRASASELRMERDERFWVEGGVGGTRVQTQASGLLRSRGAAVLSAGFGVRANRNVGFGFEYASSAALGVRSCAQWGCDDQIWNVKRNFNRASVFGELRMLQGRLRLRYGFGDNSFCYAGGPGFSLWYLALESLEEDYEYENASCSARHGTVRTASVSYHWQWMKDAESVTAGLRLGVDTGDFRARQSIGMPAFRYRAVTLTLQMSFN